MMQFIKEFFKQLGIFFFRPLRKEDWKKNQSSWSIFFTLLLALLFVLQKACAALH